MRCGAGLRSGGGAWHGEDAGWVVMCSLRGGVGVVGMHVMGSVLVGWVCSGALGKGGGSGRRWGWLCWSRVVLRGVLARRSASEVLVELVMSASGVERL